MKWLVWTVAGVLAALWTGASALVAAVVDWTASALQQAGPDATAAGAAAPAALPGWLAGWVDPVAWAELTRNAQAAFETARAALPYVGSATGWLEPLVWALWALGMVALLALSAGSHWLLARRPAAA